jgi:hypothetical protein
LFGLDPINWTLLIGGIVLVLVLALLPSKAPTASRIC